MASIAIVAIIAAFLPFLASLPGRGGIWKFLSFLFCCFSIGGAASVIGIGGGILAWIIAWVFSAIAMSARRSETRFAQLERRMLAKQEAEIAASPVEQLIQQHERQQRFITPRQIVVLVLVFGLASTLLVLGMSSDQQSRPSRQDAATPDGGITDVAVKSEFVVPNATVPTKPNKWLEAIIAARAEGGTFPAIVGVTNLPDATRLLIDLQRKEANYFAQANVTVHGGQFRSDKFTLLGKPLPTGDYKLRITMPLASVQPTSVQNMIGKNGEHLTGALVDRTPLGIILTSVSTINMGGATSRSADEAARRDNEAAMDTWRRKSCQEIAQLSSGNGSIADCISRLSQRK